MDTTLGTEVNARNRQARAQPEVSATEEQTRHSNAAQRKESGHIPQSGHLNGVANSAKVERVTDNASKSLSPNHRPTRDSFVRETPEDRASYGFYKRIPDGNGSQTIHFERPTVDKAEAPSVEAASKNPGKADASFKDAETAEKATGDKLQGGTAKSPQTKALEKQKARLEKRILLCKDSREKGKLSRQLAQVKRKLKAATR